MVVMALEKLLEARGEKVTPLFRSIIEQRIEVEKAVEAPPSPLMQFIAPKATPERIGEIRRAFMAAQAGEEDLPSPLMQFIAPGDPGRIIEIREAMQQPYVPPLVHFIAPGATPERQIEITTLIEGAQGTGPPLFPKIELPDILGGVKNTLIIAAVAIGGLFLLGKYIGKGK